MKEIESRITSIQLNKPDLHKEIGNLRSSGYSIIEAIKIIRSGYSKPLAEAKQLVTKHESWKTIVMNSQEIHDEIERLFS